MTIRPAALLIAGLASISAATAAEHSSLAELLAIMARSNVRYEVVAAPVKRPVADADCGRRSSDLRRSESPAGAKLDSWEVKPQAKPHFDRAEDLSREKKFAEAQKEYEKGFAIDPGFGKGHLGAADVSTARGDWNAALAACRKAIELDPSLARGHRLAADALANLGRLAESEDEYVHAIAWDPDDTAAWGALEALGKKAGFRVEQHPFVVPAGLVGLGPEGEVEIGTVEKEENASRWVAYASCKAVWRFEPEYRARRIGQREGTQYSWGAVEESECVAALVEGALKEIANKREEGKQPPLSFDETIARAPADVRFLASVMKEGMFDGYLLLEDVGRRCPRAVSLYPNALIDLMEAYIRRFVVVRSGSKGKGGAEPPPAGPGKVDPSPLQKR